MSPTKLSLSADRESLASDIPPGNGKNANLFLQCRDVKYSTFGDIGIRIYQLLFKTYNQFISTGQLVNT
jgi:hypothetical protein